MFLLQNSKKKFHLPSGLHSSLYRVGGQITAFDSSSDATMGGVVVAELDNLDSIDLSDMFEVLERVNAKMTDSSRQTKSVGSLGEESRLQERVKECDPVSSPVEMSTFSRVAGFVDSTESLSVLVTTEKELFVGVLGVELNAVGNSRGADVLQVLVVERLVFFRNVDASRGGDLLVGDDLEVSVSRSDSDIKLD